MVLPPIVASIAGKLLGSAAEKALTALWGYIHPYGGKDTKLLKRKLTFILCGLDSLSGSEQTHPMKKKWMADARELIYDIEDVLCKFDGDNKKNQDLFNTIVTEIKAFGGYFKYSDSIGDAIDGAAAAKEEFRVQNEDVSKRCNHDHRSRPLNIQNSMGLVGMDGPREKIISLLAIAGIKHANCDTGDSIGHKVVAITGVGGMGKTTLAASVYNEIEWMFPCNARVFVARNCKPKEVLIMLLQEFGVNDCNDLQEATLVSRIQKHVKNRRFLVILDDVWDKDLLEDIENALLGGNCGGRIIITTRRNDVAKNWSTYLSTKGKWGGDFCIKPLNDIHSKQLLPEKVSMLGKRETSKEYVDKILAKCNGSPLALNAVYKVVSGWTGHKIPWDEVYGCISKIDAPEEIQRMRKDLSHSYWDLPDEYRHCFLYLSLFPNNQINKKRLVSRWVAEGLIAEDKGKETFKELVNRNLILKPRIKYDGDESIYQVHPTIHDFVEWKSAEYNFITLPGAIDQTESKIRRISVHRNTEGRENIKLADKKLLHLRSLSMCEGLLPPKEISSVLRVLDLEDCTNGDIKPGELFHRNLRYLKLKEGMKGYDCNKYVEGYLQMTRLMDGFLSPEAVKKLFNSTTDVKRIRSACNLQTLDLRGFGKITLDKAITDLKILARLLVDPETTLPNGIGNMEALEELQFINVWSYDLEFIKELHKLRKLKTIGICLSANYCEKKDKELLFSLMALALNDGNSLESVYIDGVGIKDMPKSHIWGYAIQGFKKFRMMMGCRFGKVPVFRKSYPPNSKLERLRLGVTGMKDEEIEHLSDSCASCLSHLFLDLSEVPKQSNRSTDIYSYDPTVTNYNFANKRFQYLTCLGIRSSRSNIELRFCIGAPQHLKLQLAADKTKIQGLPDDFYYDTDLITSRKKAPPSQGNHSNQQATTWTAVHIITPRPSHANETEMVVTINIEDKSATLSIKVQHSRKRDRAALPDNSLTDKRKKN